MNILDIIFLIILGFLLIRGFFRGLIQEIASILGLILGFTAANQYYPQLMPFIQRLTGREDYTQIISYLLIFFATMIAVLLIAGLIRKILNLVMLGWADKLAGGVLGLIKGALLCSVILLVLTSFLPSKNETLTTSKVAPYITQFSKALSQFIPEHMQQKFKDKSEKLQEKWHEKLLDRLQQQ